MKKRRGKDLMIFIGGKATAMATSHSLQFDAETDDTSSKDDPLAKNPIVISTSWSATTEALIPAEETFSGDSFDELYTKFIAGDPVTVIIGIPANNATTGVPSTGWTVPTKKYYEGSALITSLSRNDPNDSNSTMSISLTGKGQLTFKKGS